MQCICWISKYISLQASQQNNMTSSSLAAIVETVFNWLIELYWIFLLLADLHSVYSLSETSWCSPSHFIILKKKTLPLYWSQNSPTPANAIFILLQKEVFAMLLPLCTYQFRLWYNFDWLISFNIWSKSSKFLAFLFVWLTLRRFLTSVLHVNFLFFFFFIFSFCILGTSVHLPYTL